MGILIDTDLHMIFTCDACHDPMLRLEDGQYVDLGNGKALLLHGPTAGTCFQTWFEAHFGEGTVYHLPVLVSQLAATYPAEWMEYSQWKGEDA